MSEKNPPIFLQAGSHPAEDVRRQQHAVLAGRPGIVAAGDLAVSQNSTPNMSVNVAAGRAFILGTEGSFQGLYFVENRATVNRTIAAADATNPRRDLVVARIRDAAYSGATNAWDLFVVQGTPAASPADPAVPANSLVLARVAVAAGATSITNANLTDFRTGGTGYTGQNGRAAALGGTIVCTSGTRPTSPAAGTVIFETDTGRLLTYTGAAWRNHVPGVLAQTIVTHASQQTHTVSVNTATEVAGGAHRCSFIVPPSGAVIVELESLMAHSTTAETYWTLFDETGTYMDAASVWMHGAASPSVSRRMKYTKRLTGYTPGATAEVRWGHLPGPGGGNSTIYWGGTFGDSVMTVREG